MIAESLEQKTIFAWFSSKSGNHIFVFFFFHNKDTFTWDQLHSGCRIFESFVPGRSKQSYLKIEEDVVLVQSELGGRDFTRRNPNVTWNSFFFFVFFVFFLSLLFCLFYFFVCLFRLFVFLFLIFRLVLRIGQSLA